MSAITDKIVCQICNAQVHSIEIHLKKEHPEVSLPDYQEKFPGEPVLSDYARRKVEEVRNKKIVEMTTTQKPLHEIFGFDEGPSVLNLRGGPIPITVLSACEDPEMVPEPDPNHVYDLDSLKNSLMALEMNKPLYIYGHAGTGKTTLIENICAKTGRPMLRVQHTGNTEESHILGQWTAVGGATKFELGPLPLAMKRGWVYLADEYDFAMPSVLAVYQPILEGKSLVIKEADAANRFIKPHPNFRFVATGNTNGSGDETGLYQGTAIQNAANYDRFSICLQMNYMAADVEIAILMNQSGIKEKDAGNIVDFANRVRESYDGSKISSTISPRTLINVAQLGRACGDYRKGIALSFANKLTRVDRQVVDSLSQRIFGGA